MTRELISGGVLFDFGKELFGHLLLHDVHPDEPLHVSYGESKEEALDVANAILFEDVQGAENYTLRQRSF